MTFLTIPESDYQGATPQVNPVDVTLQFDQPLEKDSGRGWTNFYYKVDYNGMEETISASAGLHKFIQQTGAIKDTQIRIIKKRIGKGQKDIRWHVELLDGPVDTSRAQGGSQPSKPSTTPHQPVKATSVKPNAKAYEQLTTEGLSVWELNQADEAVLFMVSLREARKIWGEDFEDSRTLQATAASLFIQGTRTTGGSKGLNNLMVPDPISAMVEAVDLTDVPASFYAVIKDNSAWFDEDEDIVNLMKEIGYTAIPKGIKEMYDAIFDLMRYGELMYEDPDHASAIKLVKEEQSDEPAF